MMSDVGLTISKQVEVMIGHMLNGSVIFIDDFLDKFEHEASSKALQRLHNGKHIMRLSRGL